MMSGLSKPMVKEVTCPAPYAWGESVWRLGEGHTAAPPARFHVVAYDSGIKRNILRQLTAEGCRVTVVPAFTSADEVRQLAPDGLFLANGPGDPEGVPYLIESVRRLVGEGLPTFGICLGQQIVALALGARTFKLPFGHHGANHPVKDLTTGVIEITSQNHNFAVAIDSLAGVADLTHVNLNDGVCEGLAARDANAFSVQHHPEAGPGPHDSRYLFTRFADRMTAYRGGRIPELFGEAANGWPPHQRVEGSGQEPSEPVGLPEPARGVA